MQITTILSALAALMFLSGCASTNSPKADPWEGMNRATFAFNDAVDKAVLTPVAKGYQAVTPKPVQSGISNAFSNVGDVGNSVNNLLQGKAKDAISDVGRFLINSTLGILGLFDVATPMGLEKHNEDFGQTLGKWGIGSGPYLVLPFLGPATLRDTTGKVADAQVSWGRYVDHDRTRYSGRALEVIDLRANLLNASKTLDDAALDRYQFLRDAFLQRRLNQIYDGKVPQAARDKLDDDLEPAAAAPATTATKPASSAK